MRIKCRGFEGELSHLSKLITEPGEGQLYYIRIEVDDNSHIELNRVKNEEIEPAENIQIRLDASAVAMTINRPYIRSDTDGKPGVNRGCCCAD